MKTILITGPIGSGKSEVRKYLSSLGFYVYDCDSRTKALYDKIPGLKTSIEEALQIKWTEIRSVFADKDKLQMLENMVYPYLIKDIGEWKQEIDGKCKLAFIESAVALGKPSLSSLYDEVLLVDSDYKRRIERNPDVRQRDSLQSFDPSKINYTITNNSTIEELYTQIDKLLCKLI